MTASKPNTTANTASPVPTARRQGEGADLVPESKGVGEVSPERNASLTWRRFNHNSAHTPNGRPMTAAGPATAATTLAITANG